MKGIQRGARYAHCIGLAIVLTPGCLPSYVFYHKRAGYIVCMLKVNLLSSSPVYMVLISLQRCTGRFNTTCLGVHASFISRHKQAYYYARQHAPHSLFSSLLLSSLLTFLGGISSSTKGLGHPIRPSCLPLPSWIFCELPWINSNLNKKFKKLRWDLTDLHTTISSNIAATCWTYLDWNCLLFAWFTFLNSCHSCWQHSYASQAGACKATCKGKDDVQAMEFHVLAECFEHCTLNHTMEKLQTAAKIKLYIQGPMQTDLKGECKTWCHPRLSINHEVGALPHQWRGPVSVLFFSE